MLPIYGTNGRTGIGCVYAGTVPCFRVEFRIEGRRYVRVRAFVRCVLNVFRRVTRRRREHFVNGISTSVFAKEIVPTTIRRLRRPTGVVAPAREGVKAPRVNGIRGMRFLLVNGLSPAGAPVGVARRTREGLVLRVGLCALMQAATLRRSARSPLPVC